MTSGRPGVDAQLVQPRQHRLRVRAEHDAHEDRVAGAPERAAHRLQAEPVGRDARPGKGSSDGITVAQGSPERLGADRGAVGVGVDDQRVGAERVDRALEVGALVLAARHQVVRPGGGVRLAGRRSR